MSVEFHRADSASIKEDAVTLFMTQQGSWARTRDEYRDIWDWRARGLSDGETIHYVGRAKGSGEIVGHIAVYRRRFRLDGNELRVGVLGNLLVHKQWRGNIVGARLVRFPLELIRRDELDAVLSFGNDVAYRLFKRVGFHDLRVLRTYADVWNVSPFLRRRNRMSSLAGPAINATLALRRILWSGLGRRPRPRLEVRPMTAREFVAADRSHWATSDRLVAADTSEFVVRRYLESPIVPYQLFGLFDRTAGCLDGYVVTEGTGRLQVWDCQVNPARLTPSVALASIGASLRNVDSLLVPTLPQSDLARELVAAGFFDRGNWDGVAWLSAYWLPTHPLAPKLGDIRRWNLWIGNNHN